MQNISTEVDINISSFITTWGTFPSLRLPCITGPESPYCAMPKSEVWSGATSIRETIISMDSTGSCESVVSTGSVSNDSSMEHLSDEERACIMYLQATIESLESEDIVLTNKKQLISHPNSDTKTQRGMDQKPSIKSTLTVPTLKNLQPHKADLPKTTSDVETTQHHQNITSEMSMELIPPPSDFMDQPEEEMEANKVKEAHTNNDPMYLDNSVSSQKTQISVLDIINKTSTAQADHSVSSSVPSSPSEAHPVELKGSPPAVAPKPKKFPPNIVIKTHKMPASVSDSNTCSTVTSPGALVDPQRVRLEALRKLGLLKDIESEPGLAHSPLHSTYNPPQTPPTSPSQISCNHSSVQQPSKEAPEVKPKPELPDSFRARSQSDLRAVVSHRPRMSELTKTSSLERAIKTPSNVIPSQKPYFDSHKDPPLALTNALRIPGISVLIKPGSETCEDRRNALRKLGILKD